MLVLGKCLFIVCNVKPVSLISYLSTVIFAIVIVLNWAVVAKLLNSYHLLDKSGHFIGFLLLTWLVDSLLKLNLIATIVALVVYSGLTEIGQHLLGFRTGQWSDFLADTLGCFCYFLINKANQKLAMKRN